MGNPYQTLTDSAGAGAGDQAPSISEAFRRRVDWLERRSALLDAMVSGIEALFNTDVPTLAAIIAEYVGEVYLEARAMKGV